ncbi:MAG: Hsp20/alpha crystallin family protein [Acidobacteria bacterium]|nr:Hsp20/alpha crystallin family protein [Acidobacteriota bacterium]
MSWDSLRELMALQDQLGRGPEGGWTPPVDVFETDDRYVVTAELPGLTRDDIQIEVHDGELVIRGRRPEPGVPPAAYLQMERLQGPFGRAFLFTEAIDAARIAAEFRDGVLTITVPKSARPEPRRIDVT